MPRAVDPDLAPMEARSAARLPAGEGWWYEPKWDGFRCLARKDGDAVELRSKAGKPLGRYLPEVVARLARARTRRVVLDGELVVPVDGKPSFDDLLQRIHPAASRIERLARERPALLVAFDLLAEARATHLDRPLVERRARLEALLARGGAGDGVELSPGTEELAAAKAWLARAGGGLDGVVAKRLDEPYLPGERGWTKVKRVRSADCVVGGYRTGTAGRPVGSLLLGLYDDEGLLHHVGFASSFPAADREALEDEVPRLAARRVRGPRGFTGRAPGGPSRWSREAGGAYEPLPHALVVEVAFDHVTRGRFRHGTRLLRRRPDKAPGQCTLEQLEPPGAGPLELLGRDGSAGRRRRKA